MTKEDILTLAKAGFTAAQIAALNSIAAQPAAPEPQTAPEPQITPGDDIQKLIDEMSGVKAAVQTLNLNQAAQPKLETADDILASIINPPIKAEKE